LKYSFFRYLFLLTLLLGTMSAATEAESSDQGKPGLKLPASIGLKLPPASGVSLEGISVANAENNSDRKSQNSRQGLKLPPTTGLKLPGFLSKSGGFMGEKEQRVQAKLVLSHSSLTPGAEFYALIPMDVLEGWHIYGSEEKVSKPTRVELLSASFELISQVHGPSKFHTMKFGDEEMRSHWLKSPIYLAVRLKLRKDLSLPSELKLALRVHYQPCTDTSCLMPASLDLESKLSIGALKEELWPGEAKEILSSINKLHPDFFQKPESLKEKSVSEESNPLDKALEGGAFFALLMAFVWGLFASLTPCIYPMIPITVSLFAQGDSSSRLTRFVNALFYVFGIALMYACLGYLASWTGQDLGSWLAYPPVAIGLSLIMLALALSMFGLFELDLPYALKERLSGIEGQSKIALFLMGAAMGFVASPCVGPFAGSIILWLAKNPGSPFFGFLMMASFGLGMGVLFLIIALFSAEILPRSGMWMVKLKQVMGFFLVGVAWYFQQTVLPFAVIEAGWALYLVAAGSLMGAFVSLEWSSPWHQKLSKGLGILLFVYGALQLLAPNLPKQSVNSPQKLQSKKQQIYKSREDGLKAARKSGKPLMLYFHASWCIPCRKIKSTVFPDPEIQKLLQEYEIAWLDCTQGDSEEAQLKNEFYSSASMPFFAIHKSSGRHLKTLDFHGAPSIEELKQILNSGIAANQ